MSSKETTTVSFGSDSDSSISVIELEETLNVDVAGESKTSFEPGESVYISVHYDRDKSYIAETYCTTGSINYYGRVAVKRTLSNQFIDDSGSINLQYNISEIQRVVWYGVSGSLSFSGNVLTSTVSPTMVDVDITIMVDVYVYIPDSYVDLTNTDSFPVGVIVVMEDK